MKEIIFIADKIINSEEVIFKKGIQKLLDFLIFL